MANKPFFIEYLDLILAKPKYILGQVFSCSVVAMFVFSSVDREYQVTSSGVLAQFYNPLLKGRELLERVELYGEEFSVFASVLGGDEVVPKVVMGAQRGHFILEVSGKNVSQLISFSKDFWNQIIEDQNNLLMKRVKSRENLVGKSNLPESKRVELCVEPRSQFVIWRGQDLKAEVVKRPENYIQIKRRDIFSALNSFMVSFLLSMILIYFRLVKKEP